MKEYRIITTKFAGYEGTIIKRTSDGAFIPLDPENTDYIAYLAWVAAGNTPDPAEG